MDARARQEVRNPSGRPVVETILNPIPFDLTSLDSLICQVLQEYSVDDQVAVRADASASTIPSLQSRSLYPPPCANARTSYPILDLPSRAVMQLEHIPASKEHDSYCKYEHARRQKHNTSCTSSASHYDCDDSAHTVQSMIKNQTY